MGTFSAERILVAHSCRASTGELSRTLGGVGYDVLIAESLNDAHQALLHLPTVVLLEVELIQEAPADLLNAFNSDVQMLGIPCLRFSARGMDPEQMRFHAPWATATIYDISNTAHVMEHAELALEVKRLIAERDLAREKLLAKQLEIDEGLRSAAHIQKSLLPKALPRTDAFDFAWQFFPCETVGGDLFDLRLLSEDTVMAYLIDVSGHGISSAMVTVSVYQSLSDHTGHLTKRQLEHPPYFHIPGPAEVLRELDLEYPFERFEKFFTMVYLLLEPSTGRVTYCSGGHPPPILVRHDGGVEFLEAGGTLVGMGGLVPYQEAEVTLKKGDRLYLYSDGISEFFSATGELFGVDRLVSFLKENGSRSIDDVVGALMTSLRQYGGGCAPGDDVTMIGIEFRGEGEE